MDIEKFKQRMNELPGTIDLPVEEIKRVAGRSLKRLGSTTIGVIAMEEAAEYSQAVSKKLRGLDNLNSDYNLIEEMADVILSMFSVMLDYDISEEEIKKAIKIKIDRVEKHNDEYFSNGGLKWLFY